LEYGFHIAQEDILYFFLQFCLEKNLNPLVGKQYVDEFQLNDGEHQDQKFALPQKFYGLNREEV